MYALQYKGDSPYSILNDLPCMISEWKIAFGVISVMLVYLSIAATRMLRRVKSTYRGTRGTAAKKATPSRMFTAAARRRACKALILCGSSGGRRCLDISKL